MLLILASMIMLATIALVAAADAEMVRFALSDAVGKDLVAEASDVPTGRSLRASSPDNRRLWSVLAPTGSLRLQFQARGHAFDIELDRIASAVKPGAATAAGAAHAEHVAEQPVFRNKNFTAVLSAVGGRLHGLVRHDGELLDVEADPATGELWIREGGANHNEELGMRASQNLMPGNGSAARRLSFMPEDGRRTRLAPDELERWTDCYPRDEVTRYFSIGVAVGSRLFSRFSNVEQALEWVQVQFANANMAYMPQLNFFLTISDFYIPATTRAREAWDDCGVGLSAQLDLFSQWDQRSRAGLWHLFDDCYGVSGENGAIGIAYIGNHARGMCQFDKTCFRESGGAPCTWQHTNTGLSWLTARTWDTFAHEVGHNFGADHAFEEGQGSTGGIMDYGDGILQGVWQFNTRYTKDDICPVIARQVSRGCDAIIALPECGNGLVEHGEECECQSGTDCTFCKRCQLDHGKECTPDGLQPQCCGEDGMFASSSTLCSVEDGEGTGYCQRGTCKSTFCSGGYDFAPYFGDFCGLQPDNECKTQCEFRGSCNPLNNWRWPSGTYVNNLEDGTICNGGAGICFEGSCMPASGKRTVSGCECLPRWTYAGMDVDSGCANPNDDPTGDWCFTIGECEDRSWGYCAPEMENTSSTTWSPFGPYGMASPSTQFPGLMLGNSQGELTSAAPRPVTLLAVAVGVAATGFALLACG